eukprot:3108641-Pyramimonas_sp.AAC.1
MLAKVGIAEWMPMLSATCPPSSSQLPVFPVVVANKTSARASKSSLASVLQELACVATDFR